MSTTRWLYASDSQLLSLRGAQHRKRSGDQQPSEEEQSGSGTAIASPTTGPSFKKRTR
mgnify:CR=1 FL=1